jgi:hypothetical protein
MAKSQTNKKAALANPNLEEARKLAKQEGVDVIYRNDKGEYFSKENYAMLSVSNDKTKIEKFDFSLEKESEQSHQDESDKKKEAAEKAVEDAMDAYEKFMADVNKEELKTSVPLQDQQKALSDKVEAAQAALSALDK